MDYAVKGVGEHESRLTAKALARTLQLAEALLGRLLHTDVQLPPEPVAALFDALDLLLKDARCSETAVEDTADRLAQLLKSRILAAASADPPVFWNGARLAKYDLPIRRRLVLKLGYPRAVYLGGLTTPDEQNTLVKKVLALFKGKRDQVPRLTKHALDLRLVEESDRAIQRVIAQGAAGCWRELFDAQDPSSRDRLKRLLRQPEYASANNEAWNALAAIAAADPAAQAAIDPEVLFVADFFGRLGPDSRVGDAIAMPPSLKDALLGDHEAQATSLALQLGLLVGGSPTFDVADNLAQLFRRPEINHLIGRRVLQLEDGWDGFLVEENKKYREPALLRVLYLLNVVKRADLKHPMGAGHGVALEDLQRGLQLPTSHIPIREFMARYLPQKTKLRSALADAADRAGMPTLPGWPLPSPAERTE